jgi:hypothetical protein
MYDAARGAAAEPAPASPADGGVVCAAGEGRGLRHTRFVATIGAPQ